MEVKWSKQFIEKLIEITDFISKDSPDRAKSFTKKLAETVTQTLETFPNSGAVVPELPAFRQIIYEGYRIVYRVEDKRVVIVTVFPPRLLFPPKAK